MRTEAVEAASRGECFTQMKAQGITPMSVKEGNSVSRRDRRGRRDELGKNSHVERAEAGRGKGGRAGARPSRIAYILLIAFFALAGGGVWWWMRSPRTATLPEDDGAKKPSALAKEVKPAAAPKPEQPKKRVPQTREERLAWFEKKYGTNIPENLKTTVYFLKNPPTTTYRPLPRPEDIFKHQSEKTIAAVLLHKPGAFVMRRTVYDESFDMDFQKALEEPIIEKDDDDEATKELKAAVNDVKAELAERMRAGEKPSKIMTDTMDTAYELGKYSRNLETMLHEMSDNPANTDKDIEDFVNAANKLLKEKGAGEMEMPNFFRRQLRLKMLARKAKMQEETKEKGKDQ